MTALPDGWTSARLGDIARWGSGGTPRGGDPRYYGGSIPWAVIGDLTDGFVSRTMNSITPEGLEVSSAKLVPPGAVLVAMYGSIGKLGISTCHMSTNQAIAFAIPHEALIEKSFLFYYLLAQRRELVSAGKGATQQNIGQGTLKTWPIPLPPLSDQRRIVDILEDHLSRLDAAVSYADRSLSRTRSLVRSILLDAIPEQGRSGWQLVTVADAGLVDLGRQRHPDWHHGGYMRPYLRVANVFEDRIDTRDVMSMDFTGLFERFRLHDGDVLLNEGQSPHLLGRPAIYRGDPPDVAFTNSLLRFRAKENVLPEWALLVFRRHMHAGRFTRESRITTNIAHLSAKRFKSVEFPLPSLEEQQRLVNLVNDRLASVGRLASEISTTRRRADGLRRAVLRAAFSGQLTGRSGDVERAEEAVA